MAESTFLLNNHPTLPIAIDEAALIIDGVTIESIDVGHIYQLGTWSKTHQTFLSDVEKHVGLTLPAFGKRQAGDTQKIIAHLPNKWLLISSENLTQTLKTFCDNVNGTMLDQSSAYQALQVSGEKAAQLLQQISFIDYQRLSHDVFITIMMDAYTVVVEKTSETTFSLYVTRSLARSFWDALKDKTLVS